MTIDASSLDSDEQLLWQGKPNAHRYLQRRGGLTNSLTFGLIAIAIGVFFVLIALTSGSKESGSIAVVLIFVGLALTYFPVRSQREATRTRYALTNQRAIIEHPGWLLRNRISVPYREIRRIDVCERQFGSVGDVMFRDHVSQTEEGLHFSRDGFLGIPDPWEVEQLLRKNVELGGGKLSKDPLDGH